MENQRRLSVAAAKLEAFGVIVTTGHPSLSLDRVEALADVCTNGAKVQTWYLVEHFVPGVSAQGDGEWWIDGETQDHRLNQEAALQRAKEISSQLDHKCRLVKLTQSSLAREVLSS